MRKVQMIFLAAAGIFMFSNSYSQKNINGLIKAEKAFASFTLSHTIKEGFLNYMDSAGLVFRQGVPTNALKAFQEQKAGPGILTWGPDFAVISASGDMGITAGPFEFREKSLQDTPVNKGTFSSIWQINQKSEWKNMADLGISSTTINPVITSVEQIILKKEKAIHFSFDDILLNDKNLNDAIQQQDKKSIQSFLSAETRWNIEGHLPYKGTEQINQALTALPAGMVLQTLTGGIASSKDFAYTYGTVLIGDKKDNYLRAWIYRTGHWQLILQTIKW